MEGLEEAITRYLERGQTAGGLLLLMFSAYVEYVFPPFPGDAVTLLGAVVAARYGWNPVAVFLVLLAGSGAGGMTDYAVGRFIGPRAHRPGIEYLISRFRRHGEAYVALNRFVPGVRALFFVAAGMARLRPGRVLLFGLLSAAAWNALVFGAGWSMGANLGRLKALFQTYTRAAWIAVGVVAVGLLLGWLRQRARGPDRRA
jgi:membrane protein DedA with SNARE-associated domain